MQLESTLCGILVVQLKPQLERLLRLPVEALTKDQGDQGEWWERCGESVVNMWVKDIMGKCEKITGKFGTMKGHK